MSDSKKTDDKPQAGEQPKHVAVASTAAAKAPAPAWQDLDYDGPLTGDQADWRNHHLKPAKALAK